jgi:hypothetical protein
LADKLTPLILDALTRGAAEPTGLALFASKSTPGLFPPSSLGRPAAEKALKEGYIRVLSSEQRGKQAVELCAPTDAGLQFLLAKSNPREVLEDFVRVLEERKNEVRELLANAARMAVGLERLSDIVSHVLPKIEHARIPAAMVDLGTNTGAVSTLPLPAYDEVREPALLPLPDRAGLAVLDPDSEDDREDAILARLHDWSTNEASSRDCPLPDLYKSLSLGETSLTIGQFHDCLRRLHDRQRIYLHPWTGPLYALPDPQLALMVGHEIAFYASVR